MKNGTVFVGAHTDTYFNKLFDAEEGALIHLDTIYGDFVYEITGFEVIGETEVDKCRWGAEEPSCILYTCYPQGIQVPTPYRYLAYADPVETDENGVVPQSLPGSVGVRRKMRLHKHSRTRKRPKPRRAKAKIDKPGINLLH